MKKLLLLTKTLLAAVLLCVGQSAWAGVSTYDFQNYCKGLAKSSGLDLTLGSNAGKVNNKNVFVINDFSNATYGDFAFDGKFAIQTTDIKFRRGGGTQGSADGQAGLQNTSNARVLAVLNLAVGDQIVFNTTASALKFVTTNVTYDNAGTPTAPAQWDVVTSGTTYTVTTAGMLGLELQKLSIINDIVITTSSETVSAPTISMTAASGKSRTVTIVGGTSDESKSVTTYYTTNGDTPTSSSSVYSEPFVLSDGNYTVKAISISTTPTSSDVTSLVVDATEPLTLNAPTYSITNMVLNGSVYNPTYSFYSNQTSIIGSPTATISYSFNGGASTEGTSYTGTEAGSLVVTVSADGYTSNSTVINIVHPKYSRSYYADFTTLEKGDKTGDGAQNMNGAGCDFYTFDNTFTELTITGFRLAHAITKDYVAGLFARTSAGNIVYGNFISGDILLGACATSSTAYTLTSVSNTLNIPQYNGIYNLSVFTPVVTATIGSTGWTTFASPYALDLSGMTASTGEVTAFYASAIGDGKVTMTSTESAAVAAGTGLMLKGTAGATITIPVAASAGTAISGNKLIGCTTETGLDANDNYYVLVNNGGTAEFQRLNENGATIPAGKAYLNAAGSARALRIVFDDITGVANVGAADEAKAKEGKFIENGKLVIVKNGQKFNAAGAKLY